MNAQDRSTMAPLFEYFIVCGIGPEITSLDRKKGYQGFDFSYFPCVLDQFPPTDEALRPPPPPQLSICVLPAGVHFYSTGFDINLVSTHPRSYPIVLTEGGGSKIYVSCIAFRDRVDEDISEAYRIPPNSYADKSICLISRVPSFHALRSALVEIYNLCFSTNGSRKPLWEVIASLVSSVPLPTPGKDRVLFAVESCQLSVETPPKDGLPHADISFQPLVQCLDVDNLIKLFTAVLLERKILLRSNKYTLLTIVSEAICHLIYPFQWQHVYVPLLFFGGVDYIDAPTPYMMGLHSGVDASGISMDGVVVVDLEYNHITTTEEVTPIPEPEFSYLRGEILKLTCPNIVGIDHLDSGYWRSSDLYFKCGIRPWGEEHDLQLRLIFLRFFASILSGYRNFIENSASQIFNKQAFLRKRSRATNQPADPMITQFLESQGFVDYLGRGVGYREKTENLLDKLQDAIGRGESPMSILPPPHLEHETITISDSGAEIPGSDARYVYDRFPSNTRIKEQEDNRKQKRKQILALRSWSINYSPKTAPDTRVNLEIKVKLQGLWLCLLKPDTVDLLSSPEYGTLLVLIESDAEGIGGGGFVECIREHINTDWACELTEEQFIAVKELLLVTIIQASSRGDISTIRGALEVSAEIYRKDINNVFDYVQRHLISLSIWDDFRFWEEYFEYLEEKSFHGSTNHAIQVMTQLLIVATHLVGLGFSEIDAWSIIESIGEKKNLGAEQYINLRGYLSHIQQMGDNYWGVSSFKPQLSFHGPQSPRLQDPINDNEYAEAPGVGRSWIQSLFTREPSSTANLSSRVRKGSSEVKGDNEIRTSRKQDLPNTRQEKTQTTVRALRGHYGPVSALHCVTEREVWDLVDDREDAGFFISGSTDCLIKIWDPSRGASAHRGTLQGHTGTICSINSDRGKIVSGSVDQSILVWDKQTLQLLKQLKGHSSRISSVRLVSGDRVLTTSHDGTVKIWDLRTDSCVATACHSPGAILCLEHDDSRGVIVAAGRESVAYAWDIRAGRQMNRLSGHNKCIRSIRLVGDTLITGSDDWTARVWSASGGTCSAVLACHSGPIVTVEYSSLDSSIFTGSTDGLVRIWESTADGTIICGRNVSINNSAILSISASEHWLGIAAADNSMSLFYRAKEKLGNLSSSSQAKSTGWNLYKTSKNSPIAVRCVATDLERKRICSGGRKGILRLWDATVNT